MFVCLALSCRRCGCFLLTVLAGVYYVELVIVLGELQRRHSFTVPIWFFIRWFYLGHLCDVDQG